MVDVGLALKFFTFNLPIFIDIYGSVSTSNSQFGLV